MKRAEPIFVVTPDLQAVLDSLPADLPKSRLEPFRAFILRWHRDGRSYRRIQEILAKECRVFVSHVAVAKFIKRRSKPRKATADATEATTQDVAQPVLPLADGKAPDRWAEARARMAQHKAQPVAPKPAKLFEYTEEDASRPIVFKKEK